MYFTDSSRQRLLRPAEREALESMMEYRHSKYHLAKGDDERSCRL